MKRAWLVLAGIVCIGAAAAKDTLYPQLGAFARVLALVEQSYIERISPQVLVERAIAGMVKSLDKYSQFIPAATYQNLRGDSETSVAHVGIDLRITDKRFTVSGLLPDAPASRSGIKLGDGIALVDGARPTSITSALASLHGNPGSKVTLTVERPGFVVPRRFLLTREPLPEIAVSFSRTDDWLVAKVRRFPDRMAAMFEETLAYEQSLRPAAGVVIDLRGNPGGFIDEAVRLLDLFLDQGVVLVTIGRDNKVIETFSATASKPACALPVAVLIDTQSASAAEIVAGALQDRKRARVFGERSFGKGSVQTIAELDDGSAVRLTTALYFTPSLRKVEGQGITPDVPLSIAPELWIAEAIAKSR